MPINNTAQNESAPASEDTKKSRIHIEERHFSYFEARGISIDYAEQNGLRSVAEDQYKDRFGFSSPAGILIPYFYADDASQSEYFRIRRDEGDRYWVPPGRGVRVYYPRAISDVVWKDPTVAKIVVEGPTKALHLAQRGHAAFALGGISTGHSTEDLKTRKAIELHPDLARITWPESRITIYFDSFLDRNPDVMTGASRVAIGAAAKGATVLVTSPPPTSNDEDQGPDDYGTQNGDDATNRVLQGARLASPVSRLKEIQRDAADKLACTSAVLEDSISAAYVATLKGTLVGSVYNSEVVAELKRLGINKPADAAKGLLAHFYALKDEWRERKAAEREERGEPAKEAKKDRRPIIDVGIGIEVANSQAIIALAQSRSVYDRGGQLVEIIPAGVRGPGEGTLVHGIGAGRLVELLDSEVQFVRQTKDGLAKCPPPNTAVNGILDRGSYPPQVRRLRGVVRHPIMSTDGSVVENGYDPRTGYVVDAEAGHRALRNQAEEPYTQEEAKRAAAELADLFCDFPFETGSHGEDVSALLTAILDLFARPAVDGPVPAMFVTANGPGVGKGKLGQIVWTIASGKCDPPKIQHSADPESERKRITTKLAQSPEMIVIDNLPTGGMFGTESVCDLFTSTEWSDRLLGTNTETILPNRATWWLNGSNVKLIEDLTRRVRYVRMVSDVERPEERENFKYPDILRHVREHRFELANKALVILAAYDSAGRPRQKMRPWGSYEAWSDLVRGAVIWAGFPDPAERREALRDATDDTSDAVTELFRAFGEVATFPEFVGGRVEIRDLLNYIREEESERRRNPDTATTRFNRVREALASMTNQPITTWNPMRIGRVLGRHRDQIKNGLQLRREAGGERRWWVEDLDPNRAKPAQVEPAPTADEILNSIDNV